MAYLVVELNLSQRQIAELNNRAMDPGNKGDAAAGVVNLLSALASGAEQGSIQITTRNASASVATDGGSSEQVSYTS